MNRMARAVLYKHTDTRKQKNVDLNFRVLELGTEGNARWRYRTLQRIENLAKLS